MKRFSRQAGDDPIHVEAVFRLERHAGKARRTPVHHHAFESTRSES